MTWQPLLALPARLLAPLLLAILALVTSGLIYLEQEREYGRAVTAQERLRLTERLALEQTHLEAQSGQASALQVRRQISRLGLQQGLTHAWLVGADGRVAAGLSRLEQGLPLDTLLAGQSQALRQGVAALLGEPRRSIRIHHLGTEAALLGHVAIHPDQHLIVRVDLAQPLAARLHAGRGEILLEAGILLGFAALLGLLLHNLWFRRAARLSATALKLGEGNLFARANLQGRDELAQVGAALDAMADRIGAQHQQLARLADLIGHSPVVAIVWRNQPGWPVAYVSDNLRRWGHAPEDFMSGALHYADLIHPDDQQRIEAEVAHHLAHGPDEYTQEYRLRRGDGGWLWLEDRTWLSRDGDGQVTLIQGVLLDISGRKIAEQALRDSEERLRLALTAANQGLYDLDLTTGEAEVSPEYATMLGYDPDIFKETIAAWRDRMHPDDAATAYRVYEDYVAGQLPEYRVEYRQRTRDGCWKWVLSLGRIQAWSADGRPLRMLGTHTDIDAIKAAEATLRELNADLEARVAHRTAELQALNQSLESFVYSVSHDLKTPLRGIEGYSRLLEEDYADQLGEEGRLFVGNIRSGVARMGELIDDLLAYSRMERKPLAQASLDPAPLLTQLLAEYQTAIAENGIALHVALPGSPVLADPDGLAMVLRNLLENAIKFSAKVASPRIEIGGRAEAGSVILWVRDNGIGFDMKYHDRIFEIFQRLHRLEDYPGTGIGLALVKKAMQRMGGRTWAESAPGEGATFFLSLPRPMNDQSMDRT